MREIKFRAWDHQADYWADESSFDCEVDEETPTVDHPVYYLVNTMYHRNNGYQYTFQQFTGLLDREGKEIYEGDIINVPYNHIGNRLVEWDVKGKWSISGYAIQECRVVGNVFEDKKLLKK